MKKKFIRIMKLIFGITLILFGLLVAFAIISAGTPKPNEMYQLYIAIGINAVVLIGGSLLVMKYFKTKEKKDLSVTNSDKPLTFFDKYPQILQLIERYSINGIGTKYFTYSNQLEDGSIMAMKWFTIAWMPVIPIRQDRIKIIEETDTIYIPFVFWNSKFEYEKIDSFPINKKLRKATYIFYYALFLPALLLPIVSLIVWSILTNFSSETYTYWLAVLGVFSFGICCYFLEEKWNKKYFLNKNFEE